MKQKNLQLFKLVAQAYEFEADKEMFIPYLKVIFLLNFRNFYIN